MSVAKVIEILAEGETLEKATEAALEGASKSVKNIRNIYVEDYQAIVENSKISKYRINAKITFVVED